MISGLRNLKSICRVVLIRLELYNKLLAIEAKIETALLIRRLVWAGVGAIFGFFALAMVHTAILSYFWDSEFRWITLFAMLLIDSMLAGVALYIANKPAKQEAFMVTKHQLAEDIKFVKESI